MAAAVKAMGLVSFRGNMSGSFRRSLNRGLSGPTIQGPAKSCVRCTEEVVVNVRLLGCCFAACAWMRDRLETASPPFVCLLDAGYERPGRRSRAEARVDAARVGVPDGDRTGDPLDDGP